MERGIGSSGSAAGGPLVTIAPSLTAARRLAAAVSLGVAAGLVVSPPADAHPHVWIETVSDIVLDDRGRITAINVEWRFDEMYSQVAIEGLDANGDGTYEAQELRPLAEENIDALKDYDYFTYARAGGQKLAYGEVKEFGNTFKDGILTLYFQVPLAEPVDPKAADFTYTIHDPSFYIAIELAAKNAVSTVGALPDPCRVEIRQSAAAADNYEYSEDFWTQQQELNDMGALFAQPIALVCAPQAAAQ